MSAVARRLRRALPGAAWGVGAVALVAAALALALRWPHRVAEPVHQDAVGFALALERFDLLALRPHPPGYPVFVAAAGLMRRLEPEPLLALASLAAVASAACAPLLALWAARQAGAAAGALAACLWAIQPLAVTTGVLPLSDAAGLLAALAVALLAAGGPPGRAAWRAGLAWGVAAGIRLSAWPVAAAALWTLARAGGAGAALRFLGGTAAGALPWLAWLAAQEGPVGLWRAMVGFAAGHFLRWGGTPLAEGARWPERAAAMLRWGAGEGLAGAGAGLPASWLAPAGLAALAWAGARAPRGAGGREVAAGQNRLPALARAWAVGTVLWVLLGQNAANPRHLLPLAALLCVAAAEAAARAWTAGGLRRWVAALAVGTLAAGWAAQSQAALRRAWPPPAVALARRLAQEGAPARVAVLAGAEARVLAYLEPAWTVVAVRDGGHLRAAARALPPALRLYATSTALAMLPPAERARLAPVLLAEFAGPPLLYGDGARLALYRLRLPEGEPPGQERGGAGRN